MNQPEISHGVYLDSNGARHLLHPVRPLHGDVAALCGHRPGVRGWRRGARDRKLRGGLCEQCRAVRGR